ncbi:CpsD/CapB family tyrosine-protein kinase [Aquisediminimonas profunda]|uniref:CpsD/CapB family tyrosine-protein kinase n=1 Tax=Aquisediminimonas profunda TaxID=1550733 RepID=UPI001C62FF08|nr:CpsD/CapB family tyrosine-protein kinase [Aquisediminimonas profunda]
MSVESYRMPGSVSSFSIPSSEQLPAVEIEPAALEAFDIVGFNSRDIRSRPFNLLRTQVLKAMREKKWRLLGVTSATPEAGKSFLCANLAVAMAQLPDVRVCLFDLDLRRGSLAEKFAITGDHGLTQFLDGTIDDLHNVGRYFSNLHLSLFPCYSSRINSAELLAGDRFTKLVEAMRALPDDVIVICDLPPTFANDDAMTIIQQLDAYMFVIEEGMTTKTELRDAMSLLSPAPCLGTVLNRYSASPLDAYGAYGKYGHYYGQ